MDQSDKQFTFPVVQGNYMYPKNLVLKTLNRQLAPF